MHNISHFWEICLDFLNTLLFPEHIHASRVRNLTEEALARLIKIERNMDTVSVFPYQHKVIKSLVWEMKYRHNMKAIRLAATFLADLIVDEVEERAMFEGFTEPILIPIPLSRERLSERGYNQTELLTKEVVHTLNASPLKFELLTDVLIKAVHTTPQSKLTDRAARLRNLKNCFRVARPDLIQNRNIILLDDVTTTGTTLSEASHTLLSSGARQVIGITLGH